MTNFNNAYIIYYNYGDNLFVLLCIRLYIRLCNRIRICPNFFFVHFATKISFQLFTLPKLFIFKINLNDKYVIIHIMQN